MVAYHHAQLDALGDATRRAILERLLDRPLAVGELAKQFPVTRPAISQHLKILKDARLVSAHAVGTRRVYHANPEGIARLRAYFDHLWTEALSAFKHAAESTSEKETP